MGVRLSPTYAFSEGGAPSGVSGTATLLILCKPLPDTRCKAGALITIRFKMQDSRLIIGSRLLHTKPKP